MASHKKKRTFGKSPFAAGAPASHAPAELPQSDGD